MSISWSLPSRDSLRIDYTWPKQIAKIRGYRIMCQTISWCGGLVNSDASVTDEHTEVHCDATAHRLEKKSE